MLHSIWLYQVKYSFDRKIRSKTVLNIAVILNAVNNPIVLCLPLSAGKFRKAEQNNAGRTVLNSPPRLLYKCKSLRNGKHDKHNSRSARRYNV